MKIKDIQYKPVLFIGLFCLSTLSSCVNTRQGLAMGGSGSKGSNKNVEEGGNRNSSQQSGNYEKIKQAAGYAGSFAAGYAVSEVVKYCNSAATGSNSTGYNSTGSTPNPWGTFDPNRR